MSKSSPTSQRHGPKFYPSPLPILVITGAGGIGHAVARRLGTGHHILLAHHRESALTKAAHTLRKEGYIVTSCICNVSSFPSVQALAAAAASLGRVAAVVHTAGCSASTPGDAIAQIMKTNLLGTAYVIEAFADVVEPGARVVCIGSMAAFHPLANDVLSPDLEKHMATAPVDKLLDHPELSAKAFQMAPSPAGLAYVFAKKGNVLRVKANARRYGERGATINTVSPGVVMTRMVINELKTDDAQVMAEDVANSAAARWGSPVDVANAIAFLCGNDAAYISGTDILVDGGTNASMHARLLWGMPTVGQHISEKPDANGTSSNGTKTPQGTADPAS